MTEIMKTEIAEYSQTAAALAVLRDKYDRPFDVSTTAGMTAAKAARAEIRGYRVDLEKVRKEIKEPALHHCRLIDSEAKRITTELLAIEEPIDATIKAEEARKAEEKEAKERAERDRIGLIQSRIQAIRASVTSAAGKSSAAMIQIREGVQTIEVSPSLFSEYLPDALSAYVETLETLDKMIADKVTDEQEQIRKAAEQAAEEERIKELRRKQQEEARIIAERRAESKRKQREEQARLDAEKRRQDEENRRIVQQRAELERQQREIEARAKEEAERKEREAEMERRRQAEKEQAERRRAEMEDEIAAIANPLLRLEQRVVCGFMPLYDALAEAYQIGMTDALAKAA